MNRMNRNLKIEFFGYFLFSSSSQIGVPKSAVFGFLQYLTKNINFRKQIALVENIYFLSQTIHRVSIDISFHYVFKLCLYIFSVSMG